MSRLIPVWLVGLTALVLAVAIWVLAVPVAGVDLGGGQPTQTVGVAAVVATTLVAPSAPGRSAPWSGAARPWRGG